MYAVYDSSIGETDKTYRKDDMAQEYKRGYIYLWAGAVVSFFSLRGLAKIAQNGFYGCRGI